MRIALMEAFPLLQTRLTSLFASQPFSRRIRFEAAREEEEYDLALCDRIRFPGGAMPKAAVYLAAGEARVERTPEVGILLTGGMSVWDAVTLSSIREEKAMLCLGSEICFCEKRIFPFESAVPYDHNYPLYQNLAAGFCLALAKQLFGEDV